MSRKNIYNPIPGQNGKFPLKKQQQQRPQQATPQPQPTQTKEELAIQYQPIQTTIAEQLERINNRQEFSYFYAASTQGKPSAAIEYVYQAVKILNDNGYNAAILYEEKSYVKPAYLSEELQRVPHVSMNKFIVAPSDRLYLPECFYVTFLKDMQSEKINLKCDIIPIVQMHHFAFHKFDLAVSYRRLGAKRIVTTSNGIKDHLELYSPGVPVDVVNPFIGKEFYSTNKPSIPAIAIIARNQHDAEEFTRLFFLRYPQLRWVQIRHLTGLSKEAYGRSLAECSLAVWIDSIASFGTTPLEAMACGVPVVGLIPNMIPDWMKTVKNGKLDLEDNGVWVNSVLDLPYVAAECFEQTLMCHDNIDKMIKNATATLQQYNYNNTKDQLIAHTETMRSNRVAEFQAALQKQAELKQTEQTPLKLV